MRIELLTGRTLRPQMCAHAHRCHGSRTNSMSPSEDNESMDDVPFDSDSESVASVEPIYNDVTIDKNHPRFQPCRSCATQVQSTCTHPCRHRVVRACITVRRWKTMRCMYPSPVVIRCCVRIRSWLRVDC